MSVTVVTGGTGTLGRVVVARLVEQGHQVRVLSRRPDTRRRRRTVPPDAERVAVDLRAATAGQVAAALDGAGAVVHLATTYPRGDEESAANLVAGARAAGVGHLLYVSIVGVDRVPLGYYRRKLAVERLIERSGLGWTVLRATQFHDLVAELCAAQARTPVVVVPAGTPLQPIDVRDVADRLVGLTAGDPVGCAPEMGGPRIEAAADLARRYLAAAGRRRLVVPLRLPGRVFEAYRRGGHLTPDRAVGTITFDDYLAERFGARTA